MFHPWTNGEPAAADAVLDITTQAGLDQVRARILREQWAAAQTLTATAVLLGRAFQAFCGEAACGPEGETSSEPSLRALLPEDVNTVPTGDVADRHQGPIRYADQAAARVCQTGRPLGCGLKTPPGAWTGRSRLRTSPRANPLSPRDRSSRSLVRIPADPWVAIRQAYETTPISFRRLAATHGIRSTTTSRNRPRCRWSCHGLFCAPSRHSARAKETMHGDRTALPDAGRMGRPKGA